jgi:HEAT repeat protein
MKAQTEKLLAGLRSENADARYAAWASAGAADPEAVAPVARLLEADAPGVRKAADEALKKIVHAVGKETGGERRAKVVAALVGLTGEKQPTWTRTLALRHLSLIGDASAVQAVAGLLRDPELQEEATFCIERIPGEAADRALMAAYADVKDDFKPRILAALGHRRAVIAADLCAEAMQSSSPALAMAGMKAVARIGRRAAKRSAPNYNALDDWQKVEFADCVLRFADAMVAEGNPADAFSLYKVALNREEEHLQCAALIGLSKIPTPEATALIESKLKSPQRNVRVTAARARAGAQPL